MKKIIDVPYLDQSKSAPTGCESVTSVMLLRWLGYDISINEFIDNYLEKDDFETIDGVLYGADPNKAFVGDPYDENSQGCYAPVIAKALKKIISDGYRVLDTTGSDIDTLISKYIDELDLPVILWATIDLKPSIEGPCWRLKGSREIFTWRSNEHCMLLTGYDQNNYYFNDPWNNNGIVPYEKSLVKERHKEQYMQSVSICPLNAF